MFPPVSPARIEEGYADFARRWNPILDVFDEVGVRFAHEVHPSEIAYDYWSTVLTLEAIGRREAFGLNWDPSHMVWQEIDPVGFLWDFRDRIYHVDCKDTRMRTGNGRNGRLSSHPPWGDPRRGWDFVSTGRGDVPWDECFRTLTRSVMTARSRLSGRTRAWIGCRVPPKRCSSCGAPWGADRGRLRRRVLDQGLSRSPVRSGGGRTSPGASPGTRPAPRVSTAVSTWRSAGCRRAGSRRSPW
jgi:hypothetical protein